MDLSNVTVSESSTDVPSGNDELSISQVDIKMLPRSKSATASDDSRTGER